MSDEPLHEPMQIGTRDAQGHRTHAPPGDVCGTCSDPDAGRWVPISQCPSAWRAATIAGWPDYRKCQGPGCEEPIPAGSRANRDYCGGACQVAAWRARRRNPGWRGVAQDVVPVADRPVGDR